jgi:hypothetical protein
MPIPSAEIVLEERAADAADQGAERGNRAPMQKKPEKIGEKRAPLG